MQKPRIKKLRATGSGVVYQCSGQPYTDRGIVVERFGYGSTPSMAYESWRTGINASVSFS